MKSVVAERDYSRAGQIITALCYGGERKRRKVVCEFRTPRGKHVIVIQRPETDDGDPAHGVGFPSDCIIWDGGESSDPEAVK